MGGIIPKWEVYGGTTASGWWLTYHLEKYMKVKWDDDIPNIWKNNPNVPNHQEVFYLFEI
jgi:hypothetical protein